MWLENVQNWPKNDKNQIKNDENLANCTAWSRLKLNTKMGLNHPITPPGTLGPLLDKLVS